MSDLQQLLQQTIQNLQLDDAPAGGSVIVYHQGKQIAAASVGDATPNRQWDENTLSLNFSTGKGVLVTLIHVLVSEGLLDYDKSIASFWPEFAQNNKQDITLRDVLTHRAGLFDIRSITDSALDMQDWSLMLSRVEQMSVVAPHNTEAESAYSALVSGWVLGGLIEKVTKLELNEALETYLAKPLGVQGSLYFGVPSSKVSEVATLAKNFDDFERRTQPESDSDNNNISLRSAKPVLKKDSQQTLEAYQGLSSYDCWRKLVLKDKHTDSDSDDIALKTSEIAKLYFDMRDISFKDFKMALEPAGKSGLDYYTYASLMAKIPAANNVASANGLAIMYAMLANKGQWQGKPLIKPEVFNELSKIHVTGDDAIMPPRAPNSMHWRLGYHRLFSRCQDIESLKHSFGHMGYNGSVAWCDTANELAVAFVHNYDVTMSTDVRQFGIIETVLEWAKQTL